MQWVFNLWQAFQENKLNPWIALPLSFFLWLISLVFLLIVKVRLFLYRMHFFSSFSPHGAKVVSVGNIEAGGTGKTPLVEKIVQDMGRFSETAILSRGYKGSYAGSVPLLVKDQSSQVVGDEPYLLAHALPLTQVFVSKDRRECAKAAMALGSKFLILDDAMQHLKMKRQEEVIVLDGQKSLTFLKMFPLGTLREPLSSLERATLIVLTRLQSKDDYQLRAKEIRPYSEAPLVGMKTKLTGLYLLDGTCIRELKGKRAGVFCAIGRPEQFRKNVEALGLEVVFLEVRPDHAAFEEDVLIELSKRPIDLLVCTEKDRVKLPKDISGLKAPVAYAKMSYDIIEGKDVWSEWLNKIVN